MERLLEAYIKKNYRYDYVKIHGWNVDGATCFVKYSIDTYGYESMTTNINIWDVLAFTYK